MPKANLKSLIGNSMRPAEGVLNRRRAYACHKPTMRSRSSILSSSSWRHRTPTSRRSCGTSRSIIHGWCTDLTGAMDGFKTGNSRNPSLSPRIPEMLQEAWLLASIDYLARSIRSGHILLALLSNDEWRGRSYRARSCLRRYPWRH